MLIKGKLKKLFNIDSAYYSGSNYSVDHNAKDESTLHIYKRHQKDKKRNSDCLKKRDVDSMLITRSILSSKVSDLDSNFINKHLDTENNLPSSSINLRDKTVDGTADIYRQEHLARGISAGTLRKKSKKDNDVQSCLGKVKDCKAQIVNCIDSSCSKEVVFDGSLDKKIKKDQSTNDLRYVNIGQVSNNQTIQSLNSYNIDDHKQKKHKKVKQDRSGSSLEKIVNNTVNDISNNYEKILDDPLSTGNSKRKHKVISDNIEAKNIIIPEIQNYFTSNLNDTEHDMSHRKKHKKRKYKNSNLIEGLENGNQNSDRYNILYLNSSVSGDSLMKKHKNNKEHILATTANHLTDYTGNKITDISEEQYLDATFRKKHKHISNGIEAIQDVNIAEKNCQEFELPSNETSDTLIKKKHKKHKKKNGDKLTQDSQNTGKQIFENHDISYLNESALSSHAKKKNKQYKENSLVTFGNVIDKTVKEVNDISKDQHLEFPISNNSPQKKHTDYSVNKITDISEEQYLDTILRKKHKKHKHSSNGTEAIEDANITEKNCQNFELPANEMSVTLCKKNHKKHKKNNGDKSTQDSENRDNQVFENHDVPYMNEPVLSSHIKKKKKENSLVNFGNIIDKNNISEDQHLEVPNSHNSLKKKHTDLTEYSINKITDVSEEQYLDATLRKKLKKHKYSSSGIKAIEDVNIVEKNCQDFELMSNEMFGTLSKKKHKKHKTKGEKLTQDSENKDNQVFENHDGPYLNEPVLSSHIKKKKEENSLVTFGNFIDKNYISEDQHLEVPISHNLLEKKHTDSVNKITDVSEEQYLDTTLRKKHKKHKHSSSGIKAVEGANIAEKNCQDIELTSNEMSGTLCKKKHKKHKNKGEKLTQDSGNKDNQIFENHNILYLIEPVLSSHIKKKDKEKSLNGNFIDKDDISEDQHLEVPLSHNSLEKKHTDLAEYSVNKITDVSEEHYVDATLRKKHKKHKHSSSSIEAVEDANIAEKNCQDIELTSNEMSGTLCKKKHKNKGEKLTHDSGNKDNQLFENRDILYLNEPVLSRDIKKKDKEKSLVTFNHFCDETVIEVINNSDDQHLEFLNSNNSLKKRHKKHNDTALNSCDRSTAIRDSHTKISNYENFYRCESVIDTLPKKKHKKDDSKIVNTTSSFTDVDQNPSSNNDMYMNLHDSKTQKRKKSSKENKIITAMTDTVEDAYEVNLDDSRSDRIHKKKHKKYKRNDSLVDTDLDKLLNNSEKLSYGGKKVSDYVTMKKQKNIKDNSKDSTSVNQTGHKVSNNSKLTYSNNFSSTNQNKSANAIENGYDLNDTRNSCIINRDQILLCASNNEKSESESSMYINDSGNIEKSKEPCKNAFEIMENMSKENENLKENKSVDLDFTEDDLDFEIPILHANESVKNLSEEEKYELISQGVIIKTGKFTHEEDVIILKNIENFLKTYDTLDISEVLGIGRLKKDFNFTKFLKAKHFYAKLGKGLNDRTLISIYKRARRLIHPYKSNEKFQETEIRSLKFLRKIVNKKWIYIGDTLGRTEDSCLQAYRWHAKEISHGKWTKEEEQQLIAAIEKVTGSSDLSCDKLKGISWDEVATHVPTRNFSQCRMHWAFHLAWKPGALKHKWDKNWSKKLIYILRNEWYLENASEIDWLKVYESFVDVAPSHIFLQKRWLTLRYQIKGFKTLSYRDTIDILCKKYNITPNETHTALL